MDGQNDREKFCFVGKGLILKIEEEYSEAKHCGLIAVEE